MPGALFVAPIPETTGSCIPPTHSDLTTVRLVPIPQGPLPYRREKATILNGVQGYFGVTAGRLVTPLFIYNAPSLDVEVAATGPLARRVVDTLTRSPRAVP